MGQFANNNLKHNLGSAKGMLEGRVPVQEIARTFQTKGIHISSEAIVGAVAAFDAFQHKPLTHKVVRESIAASKASRALDEHLMNGVETDQDTLCEYWIHDGMLTKY